MNLKKIKEIIEFEYMSYEDKIETILYEIAKNPKSLPYMLKILEAERNYNKELITDINVNLSRATVYIMETVESKRRAKGGFNKTFVIDNIREFYFKYKDTIRDCANRFNF